MLITFSLLQVCMLTLRLHIEVDSLKPTTNFNWGISIFAFNFSIHLEYDIVSRILFGNNTLTKYVQIPLFEPQMVYCWYTTYGISTSFFIHECFIATNWYIQTIMNFFATNEYYKPFLVQVSTITKDINRNESFFSTGRKLLSRFGQIQQADS